MGRDFLIAYAYRGKDEGGRIVACVRDAVESVVSAGFSYSLFNMVEIESGQQLLQVLETKSDGILLGVPVVSDEKLLKEVLRVLQSHRDNLPTYICISNPVSENVKEWIATIEKVEKALRDDKPGHSHHPIPQVVLVYDRYYKRMNSLLIYEVNKYLSFYPVLLMLRNEDSMDWISFWHSSVNLIDVDGLVLDLSLRDDNVEDLSSSIKTLLRNTLIRQSDRCSELVQLRAMVDALDEDFFVYLSRRVEVIKQIARYKREHGMEVMQPERYEQVRQHFVRLADKLEIPVHVVEKIFEDIHTLSLLVQREHSC